MDVLLGELLIDLERQSMHKLIKQKFKQARINKDVFEKAVLGNLVGDLNTEAKNLKIRFLEDLKVIEILNKWIKRMRKLEELYVGQEVALLEVQKEIEVYQGLLPEQLTEFEIIKAIQEMSLSSIPEVMKFFSSTYFGRYNSKEVIKIFNSMEGE